MGKVEIIRLEIGPQKIGMPRSQLANDKKKERDPKRQIIITVLAVKKYTF